MNTRVPLIAAIASVLVLVGVGGFLLTRPAAPLPDVLAPIATSSQAAVLEDAGQYYEISATYPSSVALKPEASASAQATAKAVIDAWIKETVATFKANSGLETLTEEDVRIQGLGEGRKYALDIHYTEHEGAGTITYLFETYEDSLGAHPNAYYRSFTFDSATGKELRIADIFEGMGYLTTLSRISREMLVAQLAKASDVEEDELDRTYLDEGTEPNQNNFQVFYFEGADLVMVFSPYQVGPWAIGTQVIRIPRSSLSTEPKSQYR